MRRSIVTPVPIPIPRVNPLKLYLILQPAPLTGFRIKAASVHSARAQRLSASGSSENLRASSALTPRFQLVKTQHTEVDDQDMGDGYAILYQNRMLIKYMNETGRRE